MQNFIESLTPAQISRINAIFEKGLEIEKAEYCATHDPEGRSRIADGCVFLSFLRVRQLYINGSGGGNTD